MSTGSSQPQPQAHRVQAARSNTHRVIVDSDSEDDATNLESGDSAKPWLAEFNLYLDTVESIPNNIGIVEWWRVCFIFYFIRQFGLTSFFIIISSMPTIIRSGLLLHVTI